MSLIERVTPDRSSTAPGESPPATADDGSRPPAPRSLVARAIDPATAAAIVPAPIDRTWMAATDRGFARRCLPLLVANQGGWWILGSTTLRATWNGRNGADGVLIEFSGAPGPVTVSSHFGYGIVTFSIPFLFRTPPGYDLLVRGPANLPRDGAYPLEGLVEADWTAATFTMNWKITRPFDPVEFSADDPVCMVVPQRRGELEEFVPEVLPLDDDSELAARHRAWSASRAGFLSDPPPAAPGSSSWQRHYFQGQDVDGTEHIDDHRRRRRLRPFTTPAGGTTDHTPSAEE